jgi:outer membrane protein OmpA-like peptidoglycan-associated protein
VAYRISDRWDLGLESQYRYYDRSDLAGQSIGKGFSEGLAAGVSLRYKFGATNRTHVRNVRLERPSPNNSFNNCLNAAEKRVRDLETNNDRLLAQLEALKNRPAHEAPKVEAPVLSYAIEFDFDSKSLSEKSYKTLDAIAAILNSSDVWSKLTIFGNTDSIGTNAYNQGLSERRANVVKDYLIQKQVDEDKIVTIGNGEEKPIDTNDTVEGRQRNRRVDFTLE